jgi:hypothetical protein
VSLSRPGGAPGFQVDDRGAERATLTLDGFFGWPLAAVAS